jgi:hypothetical protein
MIFMDYPAHRSHGPQDGFRHAGRALPFISILRERIFRSYWHDDKSHFVSSGKPFRMVGLFLPHPPCKVET